MAMAITNAFLSGESLDAYQRMGAHELSRGLWQFRIWAPHAQAVAIEGSFSNWQPVALAPDPEAAGLWAGTLAARRGALYKVVVTGADGQVREKIDPFAFAFEPKPGTAAVLMDIPTHHWQDKVWLKRRRHHPPYARPLSIYEVHLGSFMRPGGRYLTYREAIMDLLPYVKEQGYTHLEFMPLMEHPLDASWGYQLMGYFAPTSRFGPPEDFLALVDAAHQMGLGVIMDWVPGHFIQNTDALARYDGTAQFEYQEAHRAANERWGTLNFDLGSPPVQSFLLSSANFWLSWAHLDGLRVDAVSNMLYLDYDSGKDTTRNELGGCEDLAGIAFLKRLNTAIFAQHPDVLMIAEESSSYPGVTKPVADGWLGFNYKWNMGWMNDTLRYFAMDPYARQAHIDWLTFSFVYLFDEQFILPFSHDEVVHGKRSLMNKMPGDRYNQFANLRVMVTWLMTHPGKKLLFMGGEFGQYLEWRDWSALEWAALSDRLNRGMQTFTRTLAQLYRTLPALFEQYHVPAGLTVTIGDQADVLSYIRWGKKRGDAAVIVLNLLPEERRGFFVPVPTSSIYEVVLNSESLVFGGTWTRLQRRLKPTGKPLRGQPDSVRVTLPAMGALILVPHRVGGAGMNGK
ncbi:1,4-alpha-glucan branching protein GlgB [Lacticaseibacillus yichunensis]|uniref:1,4-alpha-glucan branching enzyme n=1 Tax=Lacticaseibacillus yichunensis TaxID=2486015 RepID=A0ABW4CPE2_9LACO